ncbi:MAG: hypothetical protein Q4F18_00460 [Clostridia bacterium]|nr:hypothetical protein [Clostridia bacterium]
MDKRKNRNQIQNALNATLSGLQDDPWLAQRVIAEAKETKGAKKKASIVLVLALILMLAAATALALGSLTGLFHLKQSVVGAMRGCVSTGDTLYLMSSGGLCRWTPGDDEPETLVSIDQLTTRSISFESLPYLENDALGLVDVEHRRLWRYQEEGFTLLLDYAGTEMDIPDLHWTRAVFQDGRLFLLGQPHGATSSKLLYQVNPRTGEAELLPIAEGSPDELCAYEPGTLLALARNVQQRSESLLVLDAATGAVRETLYTASIQKMQGLAYGESGLYALVGGVLSRWDGTDWISLNAAAHSFLAQSFAVMDEGYVSVSFNEMQYLPFASEAGGDTLNIRGVMAIDNADEEFQQLTGVAVIRSRDPAMTAQDVRVAIEAGDTTDLFHMVLDADTLDLIADGLIAPLNASETLTEDVRGMTPMLREMLMNRGTLYAVPSIMLPLVWRSERAIPDTYAALLSPAGSAFAVGWDSVWTKQNYASAVLTTFIAESARDTGTVDFSADAFADTLRALREADLPSDADAASLTALNPTETLSLNGALSTNLPDNGVSGYTDDPQWLLPPTVTPGAQPVVPVRVYVYLLNANAQNPDAAMAYLDNIATHRQPGNEGLMKPESAEPTLHPAYREDLEQADDATRAAMLAAPDYWAITQPRLDAYLNIFLPCLDMQMHPLLSISSKRDGTYNQMLEIIMAYVEGDTALEECLSGLQKLSTGSS